MRSSYSALLVFCTSLALLTPSAIAQPADSAPPKEDALPKEPAPSKEELLEEAQKLLSEANAFYAAEDYGKARASYQAAYELTQAPGFLYNIAQSYRLAGECRPAIEYYEKFLSLDPKTSLRSKVEGFVKEGWSCIEKEKQEAEAAQAKQEELQRHQEESASDDEASDDDESDGVVSQTSAQEDRPGESSKLPLVGFVVAGTGVVALGASLYFGLSARSISQDIESYRGLWGSEQEDDEAQAQRYERLALVLGITGGVALAGGLATYYLFGIKDSGGGIALQPSADGVILSFSSEL